MYLPHRSLPGSAELSAPRPTKEILTIPTQLESNPGYRLFSTLVNMRNISMHWCMRRSLLGNPHRDCFGHSGNFRPDTHYRQNWRGSLCRVAGRVSRSCYLPGRSRTDRRCTRWGSSISCSCRGRTGRLHLTGNSWPGIECIWYCYTRSRFGQKMLNRACTIHWCCWGQIGHCSSGRSCSHRRHHNLKGITCISYQWEHSRDSNFCIGRCYCYSDSSYSSRGRICTGHHWGRFGRHRPGSMWWLCWLCWGALLVGTVGSSHWYRGGNFEDCPR